MMLLCYILFLTATLGELVAIYRLYSARKSYEQTRKNLKLLEDLYGKQVHLLCQLTQAIREQNLEHCEFFFEEIHRVHSEFMNTGK
jgi:hypothetical protein